MAKSKLQKDLQDLAPLKLDTNFVETPVLVNANADLDAHVDADLKVAHSVLVALSGAWGQVKSVGEACMLSHQIMVTLKQRRELSLHATDDRKGGGGITILP